MERRHDAAWVAGDPPQQRRDIYFPKTRPEDATRGIIGINASWEGKSNGRVSMLDNCVTVWQCDSVISSPQSLYFVTRGTAGSSLSFDQPRAALVLTTVHFESSGLWYWIILYYDIYLIILCITLSIMMVMITRQTIKLYRAHLFITM